MSDGRVEYEITADASGLAGAARGGQGALASLTGAGGVMAAGLTAAIGAVTAAAAGMGLAIRESAKIETTETGIRTLVKDAGLAKAIMADLKNLGAETPFEVGELAAAARLLLGAGASVDSLRSSLTMLGDIASGAQTDLAGLTQVFNKIQGDGKLTGETLAQLTDRGIGGLKEEISKVSGVPIRDMMDGVSKGKVTAEAMVQVFKNLTSSGGLYFQSMLAQSQTLDGKLSTLSDSFKELLRVPGDRLLGPAKTFVDTLNAGLQKAAGGAGVLIATIEKAAGSGRLGEFFALSVQVGIMKGFGGAMKAVVEGFSSVGQFLAEQMVNGIAQAVNPILKMLGKEIIPVDETFSAGLMSFYQNLATGWSTAEERLKAMFAEAKAGMDAASKDLSGGLSKGAGEVKAAAGELKAAKDALKGDKDGDGIVSDREQRKLDLEEKRARRKANSAKGFSRERAGLADFGGLDEFFALQFRAGEDGTGFEGPRAFSAFGGDRRARASQMSVLTRRMGVAGTDRDSTFRGLDAANKAVDARFQQQTASGSKDGNLGALEAILLELKRIRTA